MAKVLVLVLKKKTVQANVLWMNALNYIYIKKHCYCYCEEFCVTHLSFLFFFLQKLNFWNVQPPDKSNPEIFT